MLTGGVLCIPELGSKAGTEYRKPGEQERIAKAAPLDRRGSEFQPTARPQAQTIENILTRSRRGCEDPAVKQAQWGSDQLLENLVLSKEHQSPEDEAAVSPMDFQQLPFVIDRSSSEALGEGGRVGGRPLSGFHEKLRMDPSRSYPLLLPQQKKELPTANGWKHFITAFAYHWDGETSDDSTAAVGLR
ncbi:hypothetical protein TREES_T100020507 [Tupaia chinensis]|uniref:Uncharacterized protein n=1 Tax=Tupaia chinensis TaxID=246437 RepID=L9KWE8_TUPCH|nr:hypothetical protein TREES_T100020507 [Tupaia chinensis]